MGERPGAVQNVSAIHYLAASAVRSDSARPFDRIAKRDHGSARTRRELGKEAPRDRILATATTVHPAAGQTIRTSNKGSYQQMQIRSYVTHLTEDGFDVRFVQVQVGHEHASTTSIYTCVSSDYRTRTLKEALARSVGPLGLNIGAGNERS